MSVTMDSRTWILLFGLLFQATCAIELLPDWDALEHPCDRPCDEYTSPMTCEFDFTVEWYLSLSKACYDCPFVESDCYRPHCITGDGLRRPVIATNRKMPGPALMVCAGDRVIVHVHNELDSGEGTTFHWHGIHQKGTPYMDGANMVTQCPIPQKGGFTYDFFAKPAGTHFWHSHTGHQRSDGLQGAFIVREYKEKEPHYDLYDHDCPTDSGECEHVVMLSDWLPTFGIAFYLTENFHMADRDARLSAWINGRNVNYNVTDYRDGTSLKEPPWEVFKVQQGKRYRFRIISGLNFICPFKVAAQQHKLKIIAADGQPVEAREVSMFFIAPGERYDFILDCNQQTDNYWLQFIREFPCSVSSLANAFGIINYEGVPVADPTANRMQLSPGTILNPSYEVIPARPPGAVADEEILIYQLRSMFGEDLSQQTVDYQLIVGMDMLANDNLRYNHRIFYPIQDQPIERLHFTPSLNNISFLVPSSPILSQPDDVDPNVLCNRSSVDSYECYSDGCFCTNFVKVGLDKVVELVLVNEGTIGTTSHPIHIHGYSIRIVSSGQLGETTSVDEVLQKWKTGQLPSNMDAPSYRDNILVPDGGFVIARFIANNPGVWFLHCHVEGHVEQGQAMLIQVGERKDFPPVPHDFPRCGYWPHKKKHKKHPREYENSCHRPTCDMVSLVVLMIYIFF